MENKSNIKTKYYDLTIPQENIWTMEQLNPNTNINNICGALFINKPMDLLNVKRTINKIIENNDVLRTRIIEKNAKPIQYIENYEYEDIPVYFVDECDKERIDQIISSINLEYMNITNNKLYNFKIIYNEKFVYICVRFHHIISDAWSMAQLFPQQVSLYYNLISENEECPLEPSYLDFIIHNQTYKESDKYLKDQNYWKKYVENLDLKNQFEIKTNKKCIRNIQKIDSTLYSKIENLCEKYSISEYSFFMGIISTYFSKIFSTQNLVIGTPFFNRKKSRNEFNTMGMFVSTLPIKINFENNINFIELCKNILSTTMSCFKHSQFPYSEIQKEYSIASGNSTNLYEIAFSYQKNNLEETLDKNIYKNIWVSNTVQSNPILISYFNHFGEHELCYDYLTSLFSEYEIKNIHERLLTIINQVIKSPETSVSQLVILTKNDLEQLKDFNNSGNFDISTETIVNKFEKIVQKNKSKIALKYNSQEITYLELNKKANCIANNIINLGYKKQTPIAIIFDKSIEMLLAMLGILKAGCYYIPILPEENQERAEYIIQNCDAKLLLTSEKYYTQLNDNIINNKLIINDLLEGESSNPNIKTNSKDLSYLIYTSGSTGKPKGVMIKHENVISFCEALNKNEVLKYLPTDISISLLKYSFDASAIDIYTSLLNGGTLILVPKEFELNPKEIVNIIQKEKVTRTFSVSKWLEQIQSILKENNSIDLSNLRIFGVGGERLKPEKFTFLSNKLINLNIYNAYGPTETTMFTTLHKLNKNDIDNNFSPIGSLLYGTRALILGKNSLNILPINTIGELVIFEDKNSIHNIANGYYKLDNLTQQRFIKFVNPITNKIVSGYRTGDLVKINSKLELEFLGREDDFVKINGGYLVSLNEIESKIQKITNNLLEICVVSVPIRNINSIILYVVKNNFNNIKIDDIKNEIDNNITFYMRPKKIIEIDNMPYTKNGKTNKKFLEKKALEYLNQKNDIILPQNKTEQHVYDIIKDIVNIDFSITDDFVDDLGIDSLNMSMIYSKLSNDKLSIQDLYNYPNVKDLAHVIKKDLFDENDTNSEHIKIRNASNQMDLSTVLLTGCTGFVGSHLLRELALNPETKKIYCIVRQKLNLTNKERFDKKIKNYFDTETYNTILSKTVIVDGDLRKENLGLTEKFYSEITKNVKTIINAAANVKHIGKYHTSYIDNVETVNNIINICTQFNISLAHISTLSLNGYRTENVSEIFSENTLNINQTFNRNPYLLSKYEAEQSILTNITEKNLNAKIFRIGNIMPRISDGLFQLNFDQNAFILSLNELINLNIISEKILNKKIFLTPVDECCKAINLLLKSNYCNTIYHIENNQSIKLSTLTNIIKEKNTTFKTVSDEEFIKKITNRYSIGSEYLKSLIFSNQNAYTVKNTEDIFERIKFNWTRIPQKYLERIVNIALKIK